MLIKNPGSMGLVYEWIVGAALEGATTAAEVADYLRGQYGYPAPEMPGEIDPKTGAYTHPGDPVLQPIGWAKHRGKRGRGWRVFAYDYAIFGVVDDAGGIVALRLD